MKAIIFFTLFFVSVSSFAQMKKAEKYFSKEKYEKSLEALSKVKISKENKRSVTLLRMKCNYYSYLENNNISSLEKGLGFFIQLYKTDKTSIEKDFVDGFHHEIKENAEAFNQKANHKKAKVYCSHLATYFQDSTDLYFSYFPKKVIQQNSFSNSAVVSKNEKVKTTFSREMIIDYSKSFVGVPYKWGGEDTVGFDCSGFVLCVMRKFGFSFNHGAKDQSELGEEITRSEAKPGDLLFFGKKYSTGKNKIDHVAVVYSINKDQLIVIHSTSKGVNIQELKEGDYWSKKILFYKNIID